MDDFFEGETPMPERFVNKKKLQKAEKLLTPVEIEKSNRIKKEKSVKKIKPEVLKFQNNNSYKIFTSLLSVSVLLLVLIFVVLAAILSIIRTAEVKNFSLHKGIDISTTPADADIFINNYYIGISPLSINNLNPGNEITLRIRKEGYKEYKQVIDSSNAESSYDIVLEPDNSVSKIITWSDFGVKMTVPASYTESLALDNVSCKEIKNYLVDSKNCTSDELAFNYNAKLLNFTDKDNVKYNMTFKLPTNALNCAITSSKCSNAKKIDTIDFLNQKVDVYEQDLNGHVTVFLQPVIKVTGKDYNAVYIEFNGKVDYKNILNMISKNA